MEEKLAPNNPMILEIRELLESARKNVAQLVNAQLLTTYWNIGRIIVEYEQQNQIRAEYGKQTLKEFSRELTREFGKGFSVSNIQFMRRFYQSYPIQQTASVKLDKAKIRCVERLFSQDITYCFKQWDEIGKVHLIKRCISFQN